ncbi:hypothetical protein HK102_014001 [Quaeritorhiza haematococci]|nr:hypothetical protein HK102_014001 [Quaeritorhiza haematococci]
MWAGDAYNADSLTVVMRYHGQPFKFRTRMYGIDACEINSKDPIQKAKAVEARDRVLQLGAKGELFISENMIGDDSKYSGFSKTSRAYPFTALEKTFECRRNDYINEYVMNNGKLHMELFDQAIYKSFFRQFGRYEELITLLLETGDRELYVLSKEGVIGRDTHLTAWRAVLAYYKEDVPLPENDDDVKVCQFLFDLHLHLHVMDDNEDEDE